MFWNLLRLVCFVQLAAGLVLFAGSETLQRELVGLAANHGLGNQVLIGVSIFAGCCMLFPAVAGTFGGGDGLASVEADRDATLALVVILLCWLLRILFSVAPDVFAGKRARGEQAKVGTQLADLRSEREGAIAEAARWQEAAGKLEKQVSAIRKQAEGQADEYMRLMAENKSLRNQLADFDLVMGDKRKKAA
eukprot:TRINITY_DN54837_c0_g1_i1.p1 TRINITY_DN54837_c0_g1~~TRINITY_DN54837_c0_g1_i1.p1  ORF type:complete len:192 (-),score=41.80 TRINITY_DN54837_c0_g1_i1:123-698(-)